MQSDVSLFEIVFCNSLNLFKNITNFEISGGLRESALTDIVNLFEIEDTVKNALGLVECLLGNVLACVVQVVVELL